MLLIPAFMVYYALRGISFFFRCRRCHSWLSEQQYLLDGICENCKRSLALSGAYYDYMWDNYPEEKVEMLHFPTRLSYDLTYKRIVRGVGQGKVLDVACGQGFILSGLDSLKSDLYGVDYNKSFIKAAKERVGRAQFCFADVRSLPFKSNTFDYLICTDVLEHIEGYQVVGECYRLLKQGGTACAGQG